MKNLTKQEILAKIRQASELIFDIERELSIVSDLRREGYRARIKIGEFYNTIYDTPEDLIPYKNHPREVFFIILRWVNISALK
jgi:hypothetical protein